MEKHEYLIQLQIIQQQATAFQEKLEVIGLQIEEMQAIQASLEDLNSSKKDNELLANLGKGIFVKTKVVDKELFVNVGKEVIVKKSVPETIKVLKDQVAKLNEAKQEIMARVSGLEEQMQSIILQAQANQSHAGHHHKDKED